MESVTLNPALVLVTIIRSLNTLNPTYVSYAVSDANPGENGPLTVVSEVTLEV